MLGWFNKKKKTNDESVPESTEIYSEERLAKEDAAEMYSENNQEVKDVKIETDADVEQAQGQENQKGLLTRLQERLAKTRNSLVSRVDDLFLGKKEIDAELLDELEEILITADLGVNTTLDLLDEIRNRVSRKELKDPHALKLALKEKILTFIEGYDNVKMQQPEAGPFVIMVVGVNGVGKTTTIGKIANKFVQSGHRVLLVAADTFRAAAIDQLKVWGERVGADVIAKQQGDDPSSVIYDALDYAASKDFDVIIVDTAGRLHTKVNLMEELKKIKRVINKKMETAPHEVMLILDATTGQNSISQAKLFNEAVGLTGLTLTKLDGTAKGGIVVNICHDFNIPIRFIGIGEKLEDLRDFDPKEFIEALFVNGSRQ
jgi:fused signal recognition particle receptor